MAEVASTEFTSRQAAAASGLSLSMVDYLARTRVVRPSVECMPGRGRPRRYSFGDLVALRLLRKFLDAGIAVSRLKRGIAELQRQYGRTLVSCPADYLVTDGRQLYFLNAGESVSELAPGGQLVFAFMCDLRQLHADTARAVQKRAAA